MPVFCLVLLNDSGPVQLYVAPETLEAFSTNDPPAHKGLLLSASGVAGVGCTITRAESDNDVQLFLLAVNT